PPSPPVIPGAFDFQRDAYFRGVGAVGFAFGERIEIIPSQESGVMASWSRWWAALRLRIAERIHAILPDATGAVAVALVTGDQGAIPKQVMQDMRDSGLAHLLSISGLHIGLVAGLLFMSVRSVLALVPRIALYQPVKKWAAIVALFGTFFYMLLAGATVPPQRAFIMTGLVLLAVIFDRTALSMRTVAGAAMVVLLLRPEALIGPSFQMSFAAVVALIAAFEASEVARMRWRANTGWLRRVALNGGGIAVTSLIATSATSPFAVFHFNRLAGYGVAANMLAIPITGFWVMAWAIIALLLMPLGLEALALVPMGWGVDAIITIAAGFAALPGSATVVQAMPLTGLILITLGGLWLCLWRRPWRWWGSLAILVGALSMLTTTSPDLLITGDGRLFAIKTAADGYLLSSRRSHRFDSEIWLRQAGQDEAESLLWTGEDSEGRPACDSLGCIHQVSGVTIAIELEPGALFDDCQIADLVISRRPIRTTCPSARQIIDRFDLWREGAHAVWVFESGEIQVISVADLRGIRPWVMRPLGQ
ncbi:MAG: ComEC/Rec2 family competence protein, partial [Dongiaceae bacterium]